LTIAEVLNTKKKLEVTSVCLGKIRRLFSRKLIDLISELRIVSMMLTMTVLD